MAQQAFLYMVRMELWIAPGGMSSMLHRWQSRAFANNVEALSYFHDSCDKLVKKPGFTFSDVAKTSEEQQFFMTNGDCYKLRLEKVSFNSYEPLTLFKSPIKF